MASFYELIHATTYHYSGMVAMCQNQLRLTPRIDASQQLFKHKIEVLPKPNKILKSIDFFQNQISYFELNQPHSRLQITMQAQVKVDRPRPFHCESQNWESVAAELERDRSLAGLDRFQYSLASPMVPRCGDAFALASKAFTPGRSILEAATELNRRIHEEFRYDSKATTIQTPLEDVFRIRRGVCQDLAHVMIACLRSVGLSARYVSGYLRTYPSTAPTASANDSTSSNASVSVGASPLVGADASHAWVSIYMGSHNSLGTLGWLDFDPTNNLIVSEEHVTLAWGRDFRDVTPINGLFVGAEQLALDVAVQVRPL